MSRRFLLHAFARRPALLLAALSLAALLGKPARSGPVCDDIAYYGHSYALVIGVDKYQSPRWKGLDYAVKDAQAVAALLRSQCFEVEGLYNELARRQSIFASFYRLARKVLPNDRVLVFFAGHGYTETLADQDYGYIIPHDGEGSDSYIAMEDLQTFSKKMGRAKHQLFIMDSCFGGLLGLRSSGVDRHIPNYLDEITRRPARQILTAGGKNQQVVDKGPGQHSVFTFHLLDALQNGLADANRDGYVTFDELASYLTPRASNQYQTPASGVLPEHGLGEFVFRSKKTEVTAAVPEAVPAGTKRRGEEAPDEGVPRVRVQWAATSSVELDRARLLYEKNRTAEAIAALREILDSDKRPEVATEAAKLLLACLVLNRDYAGLEAQVDRFLGAPELLADKEFERQLRNRKGELILRRVEAIEKYGDYRQAGIRYAEFAEGDPNNPKLDLALWNAGINFERAHLIGLSIQAREKLIATRPDSPFAKRALYRVGQNFEALAAYESAAERYETFAARQFPGEISDREKDPAKRGDAALALRTAATFRRGLGQSDKSIEDTYLFVKRYGDRREFYDEAAGTLFDMGLIFEERKDWARLKAHLNEYLKGWATKGGIDRQIVAEVKLGAIAWRDSCPVPGINGACIDIRRERASSAVVARAARKRKGPLKLGQCGPESRSKITVHERKPALVKEAMAHFDKALALYRNGAAATQVPKDSPTQREQRIDAMTYHAALARMARGDQHYERFLSMKVPMGLVFDPKQKMKNEESRKKLLAWLQNKTKKLDEAQKIYQGVILMRNAHWVIAAAARIGQLFQDFANGLYTAEVPQPPPPPPGIDRDEYGQFFREGFCDALVEKAEPLDKKAEEGLSICLNKSTELNWFNEWSKLCELELNQLSPKEYPLVSEIRAEPGYSGVRPDVAPVIETSL